MALQAFFSMHFFPSFAPARLLQPTSPKLSRTIREFIRRNVFEVINLLNPLLPSLLDQQSHSRFLLKIRKIADYWFLAKSYMETLVSENIQKRHGRIENDKNSGCQLLGDTRRTTILFPLDYFQFLHSIFLSYCCGRDSFEAWFSPFLIRQYWKDQIFKAFLL